MFTLKIKTILALSILFVLTWCIATEGQAQQRQWWNLMSNGNIVWNVKPNEIHTDHIEMSGKQISIIVTYGVDSLGNLVLNRRLVFPMLRTIPNDTRGSLRKDFGNSVQPVIEVDGVKIKDKVISFTHEKIFKIISKSTTGLRIERKIYPSIDKPVYLEHYKLTNTTNRNISVNIEPFNKTIKTDSAKGVYGVYSVNFKTYNHGLRTIAPGASDEFSLVFNAKKDKDPDVYIDANYELAKRMNFVTELRSSLILKTPDLALNSFFQFAKLRATESIYETKGGLMHSPGGSNYYAALWANDEGEFTNPFFPFIGNITANASAINCYRTFAEYINPQFERLPSSIIAEGTGTWNWKETKYGDRGDAAMLLYGASRFALAYADTLEAKRLWALIEWCAEYTKRRKNNEGVIASETDGEEGRFKTGNANLYVNSLAYNGFLMASRLAKALNMEQKALEFEGETNALRENIKKYFGAKILGFDTYKYHKDATTLSAWSGMPLSMGIFDNSAQIQKSLFSKNMWNLGVMLSESGNTKKYFERPMLVSFRGLFYSGYNLDTTLKYFKSYTALRLLGDHVPYAVEAYPEGNGRQLAGDNALYCRIITEGLFGIEPIGFNKFAISPRLPKSWNEMSLANIKAFNGDFTISAKRIGKQVMVSVINNGKLINKTVWNGLKPIEIVL